MLYQYLLDEVGRKQIKVVKKRRDDNNANANNGVALSELDRAAENYGVQLWPKRALGVGGSLGMGTGLGLGAGEPVGSKSTALPIEHVELIEEHELDQDHEVPMISRSRSERQVGGGVKKSRGKLLRRLLTGQEKGDAVVAVVHDGLSDDGSLPTTPQMPAFAARVVGFRAGDAELVRTRGGEKRLTM